MTRRELTRRGAVALGGLGLLGRPSRAGGAEESAPSAVAVDPQTATVENGRWSIDRANSWYADQPWPVGCNYIPSTAINQIETWQAETFDPATIDRELGWAQGLGFNTVRVFFHDLVWEADPGGLKDRFDAFLTIARKHGLRVIPTFFTNGCYHGFDRVPKLGPQPAPIPGVHNSGWVQSPGAASVNDPNTWERLEKYVSDMIGAFAKDDRILLWYLYNEPWITTKGANSLPLLRRLFVWARAAAPTQPLTSCFTSVKRGITEQNCFLGENCDVVTFHSYGPAQSVEEEIARFKALGRPLLCGEYMARPKSTFQDVLPILKRDRVMAMNFGLVAGKGNFQYPWGSKEGTPEPKVWLHDVLRSNGEPYDPAEVELIRRLTGAA